jgi:hypothetical protein
MKPVVFKCKRSGNYVSFTLEGDIAGMRKHEGYEEVIDAPVPDTPTESAPIDLPKRRGRRPRMELSDG